MKLHSSFGFSILDMNIYKLFDVSKFIYGNRAFRKWTWYVFKKVTQNIPNLNNWIEPQKYFNTLEILVYKKCTMIPVIRI